MKKMLILASVLLLLFTNICFAIERAPSFWCGDTNYPLVWLHNGIGYYMDKSSISCDRYNPPHYVLTVRVLAVPEADFGNTEVSHEMIVSTYYNFDEREMYKKTPYGWAYMPKDGSNAQSGRAMYIGEAAFYVNYGMKFYGFHKVFYRRLDGEED